MDTYHVYLFHGLFGAYVLLLVTAGVFDVTKFIIPNWIAISLMALFLAATVLLPFEVDWLSHIGAAFTVLLAGLVAYRFGVLGAGDVKLIAAVSLWAGFDHAPALLLYIVLAGGALALLLLVMRRLVMGVAVAVPWSGGRVLPRLLLVGEKLPYGVAIASGSIVLGSQHSFLGLYIL